MYRLLTNETFMINKPVFRIGKEKSYSDYFVANNNMVSRSHADIISRGGRYFIVERDILCPVCGFRIQRVFSDATGHLRVKCRKCKNVHVLNLAYFRRFRRGRGGR